MAVEKIRVGIIGASTRNGWGRDAHIPALSALPEFEVTAVSTSRQETADETAKHFEIPHAFADPYKMVQHPAADCCGAGFCAGATDRKAKRAA
jgi:predicted dehydrogenase